VAGIGRCRCRLIPPEPVGSDTIVGIVLTLPENVSQRLTLKRKRFAIHQFNSAISGTAETPIKNFKRETFQAISLIYQRSEQYTQFHIYCL
jgi:hypothetical protein